MGDKDTIYRQAAIDALGNGALVNYQAAGHNNGLVKAIDVIKGLPSAEPEIIRCKDCKYWREHKYARETKRYIPFCGFNAIYTKADDFCSKGTRRTG